LPKDIFKNPKTDSGFKKSAKGLLMVYEEDGVLKLQDRCSREMEAAGLLDTVFEDGVLLRDHTLADIRARLAEKYTNV